MLTPELTPSQSIASSPSLPPTPDPRPLDLVIANYNECLTWLSTYASLATVYSKGKLPPDLSIFRAVEILPNWGRESHTYLHHIVHNYDDLADVTLFLQGNIHDTNDGTPAHTALSLDEIVRMAQRLTELPDLLGNSLYIQNYPRDGVLPLGKIHSFGDWDGVKYLPDWIKRRGKGLRRSPYSPEQFWNYILNGTTDNEDPKWVAPPSEIRWTQGALFAVTRQTIQRHPRAVYERAYSYFHTLAHVNPEEGHYMERFWLGIFGQHEFDNPQGKFYIPQPLKLSTEETEALAGEEHSEAVEDGEVFML
ncbi:hypothetical protein Z517_00985 [Fonsecaea pedrosoi CBS 271.37]|uniref:Uncharacterized protein n=1 Tax=Fonsecaea pedrosoi CBS 271.37 TaxID=1442368 RepID=A0A0D2GX45_9EURO|nr:uncharacterized protein Z517_00985 [Fonsecaea pedrosoi CBS 271.37]KIW85593.1 hypothetical protein Z517_00985 [Fonsecaea pedrosoi CBS 271.37]